MSISSSAPWLKYYGDTPQHLKYPQKTIYEMVKAAADKYPTPGDYFPDFMLFTNRAGPSIMKAIDKN